MAIDLDEQDGQTPLDPDEKAELIPEHLATKGDLNDWEQENILRAVRWLKRVRASGVLSEGFCRELHKQMFAYCRRKLVALPDTALATLLPRVKRGVMAKGWDLSDPELAWIMSQVTNNMSKPPDAA